MIVWPKNLWHSCILATLELLIIIFISQKFFAKPPLNPKKPTEKYSFFLLSLIPQLYFWNYQK